jgi:hypothetical protein
MDNNFLHESLHVWVELVIPVNIPLSQPDFQILCSILFDAMGSSQDKVGADQDSTTHVQTILWSDALQESRLPGVLAEFG